MNTAEINDDTSNIKFAKQPQEREQRKNNHKGLIGVTRQAFSRNFRRFFWQRQQFVRNIAANRKSICAANEF